MAGAVANQANDLYGDQQRIVAERISPSIVAQVLSSIDGVTEVRRRRPFSNWDEIHVRFGYRGAECVVWEPFGDNSRYWIGQQDVPEPVDMSGVERTFKEYRPPLNRRIVGDFSDISIHHAIV